MRKDGKSEPKVLGLPKRIMGFHCDPEDKVNRNVELALQQADREGSRFRLASAPGILHVIPEAGSILSIPITASDGL